MKYENITKKIINISYEVHKILGNGFLEKIYENAMIEEFNRNNINYKSQCPIVVFYKNKIIGNYIADFIIEDKIIVEIKALNGIGKDHQSQLINYLTATKKEVGLILNYGEKLEIKRMVH